MILESCTETCCIPLGVREEEKDDSEEDVRNLPEKSLLEPRAAALRQANYFMDTYFDEDLV